MAGGPVKHDLVLMGSLTSEAELIQKDADCL